MVRQQFSITAEQAFIWRADLRENTACTFNIVDAHQGDDLVIDPTIRFSEEETRQIIARAASRQDESERMRSAAGTGLTLGMLQDVAREAGIDPLQIAAAASDVLIRRDVRPVKKRLGLPTALGIQRVVPGSVSDSQWERMVADFRRTFGKSGTVSQFGGVREWIIESGSTALAIRLEPLDENTLITLHQPTAGASEITAIGGTFSLIALATGALVAFGSFEPHVALLPAIFGSIAALSSLGIWAGYRIWIPRQEERIRAVLDRAELILRAG